MQFARDNIALVNRSSLIRPLKNRAFKISMRPRNASKIRLQWGYLGVSRTPSSAKLSAYLKESDGSAKDDEEEP